MSLLQQLALSLRFLSRFLPQLPTHHSRDLILTFHHCVLFRIRANQTTSDTQEWAALIFDQNFVSGFASNFTPARVIYQVQLQELLVYYCFEFISVMNGFLVTSASSSVRAAKYDLNSFRIICSRTRHGKSDRNVHYSRHTPRNRLRMTTAVRHYVLPSLGRVALQDSKIQIKV